MLDGWSSHSSNHNFSPSARNRRLRHLTPALSPFEAEREGRDELLTKEDLASRLKVGVRTLETWQDNGLLPFLKIAHVIRFYWPDVVEHLRKHFTVTSDGAARVRWGEAKAQRAEIGSQKAEVSHR